MEKYVNEDTIVKSEIYDLFSESIICPLCSTLMIDQVMCLKCQNIYCKKCIEAWKTKGGGCPNNCKDAIFNDVIEKNNNLTKFKFNCIKGCGEEIPFKEIEKHYSSDCLSKKKNVKAIDKEQAAEYTNRTGKKIPKITSKLIIFN
jgi:hypothetical protein